MVQLMEGGVVVMDDYLYTALDSYFKILSKTGYMADSYVNKLLVLCFYRDFVFHDYRGLLSHDDYHLIEESLNCLYGSNCLMPYPDYLKMGKLNLGAITEVANRVKVLEESKVLKLFDAVDSTDMENDVIVLQDEE